ncbi:hypothetical protein D3C79_782120 [compost metagenome]
MPPSAITGIPVPSSASTASAIAVICGTPTPVTIRVVQMEPGPIPTFTALTPASASALAPEAVATLPPTICRSGYLARVSRIRCNTPSEWPWEESISRTSTPAATSASTRSSLPAPAPTAAPTRRRPCSSLQAFGLRSAFWKSLTVIIPSRWNWSSTTSAFSTRFSCIFCSTTSRASPSFTVTRRSFGVITAVTGWFRSVTKRTSRPVMMPTSSFSSVTTG